MFNKYIIAIALPLAILFGMAVRISANDTSSNCNHGSFCAWTAVQEAVDKAWGELRGFSRESNFVGERPNLNRHWLLVPINQDIESEAQYKIFVRFINSSTWFENILAEITVHILEICPNCGEILEGYVVKNEAFKNYIYQMANRSVIPVNH
ncbi:MAG: hypothetical protein LBE35_09815 [Clostridiales bacterium]|jgi:hypothetical protein|nr:hypothetical protein [Clostridiales bacterium]